MSIVLDGTTGITTPGLTNTGTETLVNLTVTGNTTLGDASADTVTVNGTVTSNLIFTDNTYDIGASGATRPRTGYFGTSVITPFVSSAAATNLLLKSAGTTAITIDTSQNVCIGTSTALTSGKISLQADLSAVNAMTLRDSGTTYGVSSYYTLYQNSAGSTVGGIGHTAVTSLGINATTDLQFFTAASEKMRLDASGNLGLGVTPSAWGGGKAIDISTVTGLWSLSTQTHLISNGYYNGTNYIYKSTNAAADYAQIDNTHRWSIAPSGTAGNTISFTQAMTLDASGNLGVGTASTTDRLDIRFASGTGNLKAGVTAGNNIKIYNTTGDLAVSSSDATSDVFLDSQRNVYFKTANTQRMTLDASGNLGLGVTPSAWGLSGQKVLQVLNASLSGYTSDEATVTGNAYHNGTGWRYIATNYAEQYTMSSGAHKWYTAASGTAGNAVTFTQAMTLDASGNLGLTTSAYTLGSLLQLGRVFSFAQDVNSGYIGAGWIGGTSPNYAVTGNFAVRQYFDSATGSIVWQTAGTGTAGAAVTFATKMTLTSAGGLSFGATGTAYGTSGQALISAGNGSPTWGTLGVGGGGTGIAVGTSGGIPYFSSTTTIASSAALAASALVIGGGAGVAPATTTTGTGVITALGINTGTAGAFVVNGGALGTPSGGTVTNLTGTASININGTVGATTATTGAFTTISATSTITNTLTGTTTAGGAQIYLNGATLNRIDYNSNGVNPPAFTTRSAGTKIVLYPALAAAAADYALGIESNTLWFGTPTTAEQFKWYGGTTLAATLSGAGTFTAVGNVAASSDERKKKNWRDVQSDFVKNLAEVKHGVYDRIDEEITQVGVSAQSLQKLIPEAVLEDKEGMLSVAYGNAALVACIQLAQKVMELEAKLEKLTGTSSKTD